MKKILIPFLIVSTILVTACNSSSEKKDEKKKSTTKSKSPEDSLMAIIMEGHDVGMAKTSRLKSANDQIQKVLDSIAKLPAKTKKALEPYQAKLQASQKDLKAAIADMDKWMEEFQYESNDEKEKRLKYLQDEQSRIAMIKDNILTGLEKADSLLKAKF